MQTKAAQPSKSSICFPTPFDSLWLSLKTGGRFRCNSRLSASPQGQSTYLALLSIPSSKYSLWSSSYKTRHRGRRGGRASITEGPGKRDTMLWPGPSPYGLEVMGQGEVSQALHPLPSRPCSYTGSGYLPPWSCFQGLHRSLPQFVHLRRNHISKRHMHRPKWLSKGGSFQGFSGQSLGTQIECP